MLITQSKFPEKDVTEWFSMLQDPKVLYKFNCCFCFVFEDLNTGWGEKYNGYERVV